MSVTSLSTFGTVLRKRFGALSLRTVILAGGLLCAVVPAAILGFSSAYAVRSLIVQDTLDRSQATAGVVAAQLEEYLQDRLGVASQLAETLGVQGRDDQATLLPWLSMTRAHFPEFGRFGVVGLNGHYVASDPAVVGGVNTVGRPLAEQLRPFFAQALRTRKGFIDHRVTLGLVTKLPSIRIIVPVFGRNGAPVGVLFAVLDADRVQTYVERQQHEVAGRVEVAAENGHIIASQDPSFLQRQFDFSGQPIWRFLARGESGQITSYPDERGEERLAGFATVPSVGWKVWVSRALPEINREVTASYGRGLEWFVIFVLLSVIGIVVMTRAIVRPIDALRATANNIAEGNLGERASESRLAELGMLARSINRMAAALQESLDSERVAKQRLESSVRTYGELAARVAAGDLTARVTLDGEDDELGQLGVSLNRMAESLQGLVDEIRAAASSLASATSEILAATSQQVSSATEEAAAVRQTTATVLEVRQTAEMAARKTKTVAELAQRVEQTAETGRQSIEESLQSSDGAKARMVALAERILAFSEQAQAIAEINAAVAELAGQSNLLAVNAGIEAAKAGDASKGFAVVAAEVKELGARSKEATIQVRRIVTEIQKAAQSAVMAAEQGVKAAEVGTVVAQRSGEAMEILAASIAEASEAAQQISASAVQQQAGMDQIAQAMQSIEQASTQTVAATQQVERAAADLSLLAQKLNDTIRAATEKDHVLPASGV